MKADIKIDWKPENIEANLQKHKDIIKKGMESGLEQVILDVAKGGQEVLSQRAATAGNLRIQQSLSAGSSHNISKVMSSQRAQVGTKYPGANLVKKGTKPHAAPFYPIMKWIEENAGALRVSDVRSATQSVRQHIAARGTAATEFLSRGTIEKSREIKKAVEEAAEKILRDMGLK